MLQPDTRASGTNAEGSWAPSPWRFCVAPMMDWTDRHCRYFHRQLSSKARLYTEMVHTGAILRGDARRHLRFEAAEQPLALQVGGADAGELAAAAEIGATYGYAEINLNCGCPSDRVQEGQFGACLMADPARVREGVRAMRAACGLPVTVKCRIGIDDSEGYEFLKRFVLEVAEGGATVFIVHARKAWLSGLSPKENREIPPLDYEVVYRLKQEYPEFTIVLNGGLISLDQCAEPLRQLDGVMLGRAPYENPFLLAEVDARLFGAADPAPTREAVLRRMQPYIEREIADGGRLAYISRHLLGLFRQQPGGKAFRRALSELAPRPGAGWPAVEAALAHTRNPPRMLADIA